jgi:hypothetical protein
MKKTDTGFRAVSLLCPPNRQLSRRAFLDRAQAAKRKVHALPATQPPGA